MGGGNFLEFQSDGDSDFILGVGTFIYKEKYGKESLKLIYDDFTLEMALRDFPIYGHFAFVIKKSADVFVFGDNNGSLRLYCARKGDCIIVSNSEVSCVIPNLENPVAERSSLSAFLAGKFCSEIPFIKGIELFDYRNVLIVDKTGSLSITKKEFPEIPRIETLEDANDYCKTLIDQQKEALNAFKGTAFSVELTGGLDSRLVSAVINSSGNNYDFVNYSGIYGPDTEIAKIVSSGMNKRLVMIDDPKDYDFQNEIGEYDFGFNFFRHYPSKRWSVPNIIQFSGLYGECLTYPEVFDSEQARINPTLESVLKRLVLSDIMPSDCQADIIKHLSEYLSEHDITKDGVLSEIEQDILSRFVCGLLTHDYMYISACNACMYFYAIYNEWHFSHFISNIAFAARDKRKLSISLIKSIDKEVGSYPIISRLRTKRDSVNEISELPSIYKSYNWYKQHLPQFIVNYIYGKVGRSFPKHYSSQIDYSLYINIVDIEKLQRYPNVYYITLQRLYSFDKIRKELRIKLC